MQGGGEPLHVRVLGDQAHRAAHGARAVQGPLRAAQHLDVVDVEHARVERVRQYHIVDVEAGDVLAGDAADRNRARRADAIAGGSEGEVRHLGGVVEEAGDRLLLERGARESGHRHRHALLALRALLRRDDHFLQPARLRRRLCGRVRRGSRGQPYTCDQHDPRLMHAHGLSPPAALVAARRGYRPAATHRLCLRNHDRPGPAAGPARALPASRAADRAPAGSAR